MTKQENDSLRKHLIAAQSLAGASLAEARATFKRRAAEAPNVAGVEVTTLDMGGVAAERLVPTAVGRRSVLYLHGGGYVFGSPTTHRQLGAAIALAAQASVFVIDYRLAPEHPFPAALDDAMSAYRWLIGVTESPSDMAVAGDSAGGGLAVATLMAARDEGLPLPAACVAISPWADMTCSAASFNSKAGWQPNIERGRLKSLADAYLAGQGDRTPLASPIFGDLAGLPPLLIHVGSEEALLDDSRALHDRAQGAGVETTLEVWDDMVHVWHNYHHRLSEARDAVARIGGFLTAAWQAKAA